MRAWTTNKRRRQVPRQVPLRLVFKIRHRDVLSSNPEAGLCAVYSTRSKIPSHSVHLRPKSARHETRDTETALPGSNLTPEGHLRVRVISKPGRKFLRREVVIRTELQINDENRSSDQSNDQNGASNQ
ncbi:hypothetical protein RRG08_053334 [Elysia crispata]|uniref:Uncharacterized protein n=1 Tax=Elysia crispata TaxID=231223 RepID=A0AAE0ZL68_9GAST|nr:hypothetical protein RRG08_053334 [Elysia crispata]